MHNVTLVTLFDGGWINEQNDLEALKKGLIKGKSVISTHTVNLLVIHFLNTLPLLEMPQSADFSN